MRRLTHPLSRAVYEWADDGVGPVKVVDRSGREGRFTRDGQWLSGELDVADPEVCRWIVSGGPQAGGAAGRSRRFDTADEASGADTASTGPDTLDAADRSGTDQEGAQ